MNNERDFLFSRSGKAYLENEYTLLERSTHDIAKRRGTYANLVRRALLHHGIPLRTKAEAQKRALESGRHLHPTRGEARSRETKDKIGEGVSKAWGRLTALQRATRVRRAKTRWDATSEQDRREFRRSGLEALRSAAVNGSKIERFLKEHLQKHGYAVRTQCKVHGREVDIFLPDRKTVIQVDGPGHHLPLWGEERLNRVRAEDDARTQTLLAAGLNVVRVKNLARNLSEFLKRKLLTKLISVLESNRSGTPELVETEVE